MNNNNAAAVVALVENDLHKLLNRPQDCVMVKIFGGIEPEMKLHFSPYYRAIPTSSNINICLQCIRFPKRCPQEFNVHLIVEPGVSFAVRELQTQV